MAREYTREIYLYINGKQINNDIKSIRHEMTLLVNEQAKMIVGSKEYVAHGEKIRSLKGILNEHTSQLKNVNRTWGQTMNAMGDWFNRFQALAVAAIAGVIGVVMAFRKTTEASMLMEERMDNLSAITGLTGRSLEFLGKKAKESSIGITDTGVRIKQSATDIVDAYTKLGSQRPELLKNKEDLAAVTEAAIVLSEAAKSKLEPATLALTTTMNQFNLGASEANRIINVLGAGALVGAGEIPYLTEVLEKSGTTASLMGISIEQMTGIIEGVAPKFQMAEVAGTSLDRVLLKLRKLGIGFKDGVFDMNRAIDELSVKFKSGESAVKIFGVHQAKMGEVLVMNRDAINEMTRGVTGTTVAFEQAGKNTDNMAAKLAQAKNKVTLMYMEVGEKLAPAVIFSTNSLNIFLRTMMALPKIISENRVLITSLVGALLVYNGELIKGIGVKIWDTAVTIKNTLANRLSAAAKALEAAMTAVQVTQTATLTIWQRTAITLQYAWNAAMLANPVGMVIAGITALVVALQIYNRHSKGALANEAKRKELTSSLASSVEDLKVSYQMLVEDQDQLNRMSRDQKKNLASELKATIALAEANYDLQKSKVGELRAENSKLSAWQFLTTWSSAGKIEKARSNGEKFVQGMTEDLKVMGDTIQSMKDKKLTLTEILSAESTGDRLGTESMVMMEEKLSLYRLALDNAKTGTEDYIRILAKFQKLEKQIESERGSQTNQPAEKFKRAEALADIVKAHDQEVLLIKQNYNKGLIEKEAYENDLVQADIRYQMASIARLKKFGQDTIEEETKVEDALIKINEDCMKDAEDAAKKKKASLKMWDDEYEKFLEDIEDNPDFTQDQKDNVKDYIDWFNTTQEGQREANEIDHDLRLITDKQYYAKLKALDKEAAEKRIENVERWAGAATGFVDLVGNYVEIAKQQEMAAAGEDDKKKEVIEKKYAKRQKAIAIAQTVIEGAVEIARINSNSGVNFDLTQTLRTVLTALAVARTVGTVALISATQYSKGKYPVKGDADGRIYQAALMGPVKTGYYTKPTLGLFSEREPEIVIDGPTTRNIRTNFPEILSAINGARVNQFAGGKYPDMISSPIQESQAVLSLLQENIKMMRQVISSHETPGTVSFSSIRDSQTQFEKIKSKTTLA